MCIDFNPRLREGGDIICIVGNSCIVNFNPRLREGGDFSSLSSVDGETISIHASAKEATSMIALDKLLSIFQSTPPRRRRQWTDCLYSSGQRFQSTPPRRRRRVEKQYYAPDRLDFNPRLREGGDCECFNKYCRYSNFNPRLREGGDLISLYRLCNLIQFQSTPPRRRRLKTFISWLM